MLKYIEINHWKLNNSFSFDFDSLPNFTKNNSFSFDSDDLVLCPSSRWFAQMMSLFVIFGRLRLVERPSLWLWFFALTGHNTQTRGSSDFSLFFCLLLCGVDIWHLVCVLWFWVQCQCLRSPWSIQISTKQTSRVPRSPILRGSLATFQGANFW